jgi:Spy/CpxP family protein refolding chaperone
MIAVWVSVAAAQGEPRRHGMGGDLGGGPPTGPPAFSKQVFSPRLVMEHQLELGLRPEQIDGIKKAMLETQQKLLELQWKLDAKSEALSQILAADRVDEAKVLTKLDEVTAIERDVKRTNFALLVRVKNQLDPEQQAKMRKYRPAGMMSGGPPPGPPPPE